MPDERLSEAKEQTPEWRREIAVQAIAKYCCIIAGVEPVDSMGGSPHWWLFMKEAEALYDDIVRRFPAPTSARS